jgi:AraC-like DNA-binding protein
MVTQEFVSHETKADWTETYLIGPGCRLDIAVADRTDTREFLENRPLCPALHQYGIAHAGVTKMTHPMRVVRRRLTGTFFLATLQGRGRVLVDGFWKECRAGQAFLLPPLTLNAFEALPGEHWDYAYVRYAEASGYAPWLASGTPALGDFDVEPFWSVMEGLVKEATLGKDPAAAALWVELAHHYVLVFSERWRKDERLWRLWKEVNLNLDRNWTVVEMAKMAGLSSEHLRRLCQQELGRSPMKQVTFLRMRHAAGLLATTKWKTEAIARMVGYADSSIFSKVFKRWIGWPPRIHRRQMVETSHAKVETVA